MTTKLFAATALTALLVTASAASADPGNPISGQPHSTEAQGDIDLTVIQGYGQVQNVMGSNNYAAQSAGTLFEDTAVQGNVTSTVTQGYGQVQNVMGSYNHAVQHAGSIGAPK